MFVNRVHPSFDVFERILIREVEGDDYAVRLSVKLIRNRPKSFLPRRVPNLDIHILFAALVLGRYIIDSNGANVAGRELSSLVLFENGGLSDRSIPQNHDMHFVPSHLYYF